MRGLAACEGVALLAGKERLDLEDALVEIGSGVITAAQLVEQLAVLDEQDAVGVGGRDRVVRDHHDGGMQLRVQHLEGFKEDGGVARIERAGGLVGKDQLRVGDDGARRGHALTLAARHLARIFLQDVRHAQHVRGAIDLRADGIGLLALDGKGQGDVLETGQGVQQVGVLEDEAQVVAAELGELTAAQLRDIEPV